MVKKQIISICQLYKLCVEDHNLTKYSQIMAVFIRRIPMNSNKFIAFLSSLKTEENTVLVESVAAGFLSIMESEIELTTKDDGKLPIMFVDREVIDENNAMWKSDVVNFVISTLGKPGKPLKESEYRIILNPTAMIIVDKVETIYLKDYPQWIDLKERFIASHPDEMASIAKRNKFRNAISSIDPDRWIDKKTGKSVAGKSLAKEGVDIGSMTMDEMRQRAEAAYAKKEKTKFSDINEKLFRS